MSTDIEIEKKLLEWRIGWLISWLFSLLRWLLKTLFREYKWSDKKFLCVKYGYTDLYKEAISHKFWKEREKKATMKCKDIYIDGSSTSFVFNFCIQFLRKIFPRISKEVIQLGSNVFVLIIVNDTRISGDETVLRSYVKRIVNFPINVSDFSRRMKQSLNGVI